MNSLYRYTKKTGFEQLQGDFQVVGGMDWNTDTNTFYVVDVVKLDIKAFDWDPDTGQLAILVCTVPKSDSYLWTLDGKKNILINYYFLFCRQCSNSFQAIWR